MYIRRPDRFELRASDLFYEQVVRYKRARKEANDFLVEPCERVITAKISQLCAESETAEREKYVIQK